MTAPDPRALLRAVLPWAGDDVPADLLAEARKASRAVPTVEDGLRELRVAAQREARDLPGSPALQAVLDCCCEVEGYLDDLADEREALAEARARDDAADMRMHARSAA